MARAERFHFSHTRKIESAYRYVSEAADAGVILNNGEYASGREVVVDGTRLENFGSCSYMALETMPELRDCAHQALDEYGTQFHYSRAYLQCSLYLELDALLEQLTGRPVVVAASTSLAHMAALPVLVKDVDHLVIDQFAHASLHAAVHLLPKVPLEVVRHSRLDRLDAILTRLRPQGGKVWYVCDGLYSMLGDFAPFSGLKELLDRHEHLRLYIDDAHSTSWTGTHGRGIALEHFGSDERVVVALSLNKAFSAAGGALALPSRDLCDRVRRCGGPMLFSGPIQPPMLGAAVGSARLHLSSRFPALQAELDERLRLCLRTLAGTTLDLASAEHSPIFQAQCDSPRIAFAVAERMKKRGFYCCVCVFPAVPMNRPGLRFTMTRHNQPDDIVAFLTALGTTFDEVRSEVARTGHDRPRRVREEPDVGLEGLG
jgi:7-keto-8-aminopelargonate synthetase-like enzyme